MLHNICRYTLPKTNSSPLAETQKESSSKPTIHFQGVKWLHSGKIT